MTANDGQASRWPELPLDPWRPTYRALHMWTQVVGKTVLALTAPQNHWWNTALRVSARGLATATPLVQGDRAVDVELDLVEHALVLRSDEGRAEVMPLGPCSVHSFHDAYLARLRALGIDVRVWTTPVECADPIPFDRDDEVRPYDAEAAHRFWQVLRRVDGALKSLADGFVGKQSPVHFFWGSFDLAVSRFSGERAPERPGADAILREGYSHETISFGFWPGGKTGWGVAVDEPVLFAYAAPAPPGFAAARVRPAAARWHEALGEFVLPYEAVRQAPDPAAEIRAFCEDVYAAAATLGLWDRGALEREPPRRPPSAAAPDDAGAAPPR